MHLALHLLLFLPLNQLLLGGRVANASEAVVHSGMHVPLVVNRSKRCRSVLVNRRCLIIRLLEVVVRVRLSRISRLGHRRSSRLFGAGTLERIGLTTSHFRLISNLLELLPASLDCRLV